MKKTTRREFVRTGVAASVVATGAMAAPTVIAETAKGANERLGVGFIGTGGRSNAHQGIVNNFKEQGIAQPVAVCDVYRPRLEAASKKTGGTKMYDEHEALLADPNVDVVCIASPDRLHAPQTIDALNAGKDVYCEKPLTHWAQFELAKKIEETSKKTGKLVQVGTQHMADDNYPEIIRLIHEGIIGKPVHVECSYFRRGDWGERMRIPDPKGKEEIHMPWKGQGDTSKLWADLLDCVKTRRQPKCNIGMAVRVQAPLSMGILSHRESKVALFDQKSQSIQMS